LLNHNTYSDELAEIWEEEILIRNVKTFNMISDYNVDPDRGEFKANETLL
jgi:hypothetical protein